MEPVEHTACGRRHTQHVIDHNPKCWCQKPSHGGSRDASASGSICAEYAPHMKHSGNEKFIATCKMAETAHVSQARRRSLRSSLAAEMKKFWKQSGRQISSRHHSHCSSRAFKKTTPMHCHRRMSPSGTWWTPRQTHFPNCCSAHIFPMWVHLQCDERR